MSAVDRDAGARPDEHLRDEEAELPVPDHERSRAGRALAGRPHSLRTTR